MRILRMKMVVEITGLARSTVYKYIAEGIFPKPITLGGRSVGWVESEVFAWIQARLAERN
ncbi:MULTISPECIES: AlpA family transcriptional regulator [Pseudomonas]|uniref:helix-turn-helix transcriptional regulator n=1 Tax=Pseudomonas TaxID=286 RepID=UPI000CFB383E|nr:MULTISPECIES: AlpA family transcriptional regulator [Pseudomonas]PQZ89967.1 AlpA family transcriptional regulator [Pseudomonas trivialis]PRB25482.1 AlpA family transcriptional regulator [Pseudomonas sp. MYb60]